MLSWKKVDESKPLPPLRLGDDHFAEMLAAYEAAVHVALLPGVGGQRAVALSQPQHVHWVSLLAGAYTRPLFSSTEARFVGQGGFKGCLRSIYGGMAGGV
jgi:hypothetical protein